MNITVILAGLLALVGAFGGGYWWGGDAKENEMRADQSIAEQKQIKEHNENAVIDMQAAAEHAARNARAQGVADGRKAAMAEFGRRDPPGPGCVTAPAVRGVLNDAINDSNDRAPATDRVRGSVPAAPAAPIGGRTGPAPVGTGSDQASGRLPGPAR